MYTDAVDVSYIPLGSVVTNGAVASSSYSLDICRRESSAFHVDWATRGAKGFPVYDAWLSVLLFAGSSEPRSGKRASRSGLRSAAQYVPNSGALRTGFSLL